MAQTPWCRRSTGYTENWLGVNGLLNTRRNKTFASTPLFVIPLDWNYAILIPAFAGMTAWIPHLSQSFAGMTQLLFHLLSSSRRHLSCSRCQRFFFCGLPAGGGLDGSRGRPSVTAPMTWSSLCSWRRKRASMSFSSMTMTGSPWSMACPLSGILSGKRSS